MATGRISSASGSGFSARLMGKGSNAIPGSLGPRSPKKLHSMGKTLEAETKSQEEAKPSQVHSQLKLSSPSFSPPPSKTSNCKDTHSLWKSVQDCHASLMVANPRHFEFAVANLCFLLKAYGRELDKYAKFGIDQIFQTIRILALDPSKRPTTRMQLLKVIELRARSWDVEKRAEQITEMRREQIADEQQAQQKDGMKTECNSPQSSTQPAFSKTDEKTTNTKGLTLSGTGTRPTLRRPTGTKVLASAPLATPRSDQHHNASKTPDTPDVITQPSPKSTGFWDAVTSIPEFYPHLPPISEEVLSEGLSHCQEGIDSEEETLSCLSELNNSMASVAREKQGNIMLPLMGGLPEEGAMYKGVAMTPVGYPNMTTATSPADSSLVPTERTFRLSEGSTCSSSQPVQYTREFLLKCWDSPLCRVMPAALQHTIPHSDIHFIIKIPTFEDPTCLLQGDFSPPTIKPIIRHQHPNKSSSDRMRHFSWPSACNMYGEKEFRAGAELY